MSEYLDRAQFGPFLATIDAVSESHVSLRIAFENAEFGAESANGETTVKMDTNPSTVAEMFHWLSVAFSRPETIHHTVDAIEPEMRRRIQKTIDEAFTQMSGTFRDMDQMSHRVHQAQIMHQNESSPKP
jgi:hypothetical protein